MVNKQTEMLLEREKKTERKIICVGMRVKSEIYSREKEGIIRRVKSKRPRVRGK